MSRLRAGDELSGEDVLPGFRCRVDDLFPKPSDAGTDSGDLPGPVSPSPASRRRFGLRIHVTKSITSGNRHMPDPHDTTEDHPPREPTTVNESAPDSFIPGKRVIEESGAEIATETRWLLHKRLRAASLVLVVGFALFFARSLVLHWTGSNHGPCCSTASCSACCFVSLALSRADGSRRCVSFGGSRSPCSRLIIASFMAAQYFLMLRGVRDNNPIRVLAAVKSSVLWMLAMIFTYAIFIPNNWVRAAKLIVPMALAPMAVPWILGLAHPELYQVAIRAANFEKISEDGLFLLLGAFTAIFGTHTINTLRTEAYEAKLLNQYRLGRKLGGGGMGEVYLAEHQLLKRPCAIKLIRHDLVGNPRVFARFEREVRATARLSHWNTIEIFDYGRNDDGAFYYVMEYLPGLSLATLVARFGPMPPARVIYLLRQACDALCEAHDAGLIHRDIKPANLMAAYRGGHYDVTKLLDFGLVKDLERRQVGSYLAGRDRRRLASVHGPRAGHA